jgi:folylpolyglutamate synthase/dihydropteroate synthase
MNASADSYVDFWRSLQPSSEIKCSSSLKDTMTDIGKRHERHLTLITGSTYLVGEALRVLQSAGKLSVDEA